jgi:hypothetical protein
MFTMLSSYCICNLQATPAQLVYGGDMILPIKHTVEKKSKNDANEQPMRKYVES